MSSDTLQLGLQELQGQASLEDERIRQPGGGRKSAFETIAGLDEAFLRVLVGQTHTFLNNRETGVGTLEKSA